MRDGKYSRKMAPENGAKITLLTLLILYLYITHLCLMDFLTIIDLTNLFQIEGLLGSTFQLHSNFESKVHSVSK